MTDSTSGKAFNNATGKTSTEDAKRRATRMMKEKQFFEGKAAEHRGQLHSTQTHENIDLGRKHDRQKANQLEKLHTTYGAQKDQTKDQLKQLKAKADKSRLTQDERDRAKALQMNLGDIQKREKEQRGALQKQQAKEKQEQTEKHKTQTEQAERTIQLSRQQRQAAGWKPAPVVFDAAAVGQKGEMSFQKLAQSAESSQGAETTPKSFSGAPRPTLVPKGARTGNLKPAEQVAGIKGSGKKLDFGL